MRNTDYKVVASVMVRGVADMTPKQRKAIVAWLRKLAIELQRRPGEFAKTFRAHYLSIAK
jgi:hypothetical protein